MARLEGTEEMISPRQCKTQVARSQDEDEEEGGNKGAVYNTQREGIRTPAGQDGMGMGDKVSIRDIGTGGKDSLRRFLALAGKRQQARELELFFSFPLHPIGRQLNASLPKWGR
jgi:hypothetical protein